MTSKWDLFRLKHGLHDHTEPLAYASAVFQAANSLLRSKHEHECVICDQIKEKIEHLEELRDALR